MSDLEDIESNEEEIIQDASVAKLTEIVKNAHQFATENLEDISDLQIKDYLRMGKDWRFYDDFKEKTLFFTFNPSAEIKDSWESVGFKKLPHLLNYLKKKYGGLEKFDVIFFNEPKPEPYYYMRVPSGLIIIYINILKYLEYGNEINPEINKLKITKYAKNKISFYNKQDIHL